MSIRIKLPAKAEDAGSPLQHIEPPLIRRKSVKRRVLVDSDDEDGTGVDILNIAPNRSKRPRIQRSRTNDSSGEGVAVDLDRPTERDVDPVDSRLQPHSGSRASSSANIQPKHAKTGGRANAEGPSLTKKIRTVLSESESEDICKEDEDSEHSHTPSRRVDDDGAFVYERKQHAKQTSTWKGKRGKGVGTRSRVPKGKAKIETKEVLIKDERKVAHVRGDSGAQESGISAGAKRPRSKVPLNLEDVAVDIVGDSVSTPLLEAAATDSPPPAKEESPRPPPPKKRKLPTIKKNKGPGSAGPATPSSVATPSKPVISAGAQKLGGGESGKVPPVAVGKARKPAATVGNADFDLRNASVYADLFKTAGGSTPRSGLNRRDKEEERRRELNKLRDEARAKRTIEAQHTFDLQGQLDKISRFEEKLRCDRSSALYPNFLAAKWREEWERDKRRNRESEWEGKDNWNDGRSREEGEMKESR